MLGMNTQDIKVKKWSGFYCFGNHERVMLLHWFEVVVVGYEHKNVAVTGAISTVSDKEVLKAHLR
ncbi:hypothetical protein NXW20_00120 [Bacteroides faecis]|nr:hypothetical protein [Bacteroides faecis]MCS2194149.1 hypothetical protein [Bacteroides faecis]